jgi:pimeloyl-ACP methyl ester carboxylesterase
MKHPLNDLVVVLPGIMGSALADRDGKEVWGTSLGSIVRGVLTRGAAIKRLQLPDGIGDDPAPDGVTATKLMPDIHVIPGIWSVSIGYERMVAWFRDTFDVVEAGGSGPANFVQFPYDWRLSNRASAVALGRTVEPLLEQLRAQPGHEDAKVVFVGHSMGGLVARYYVDVLGGHEITRKVITLGTPHRGALNALDSLVNGVTKGFGPFKLNLTTLSRSLPSLFQLLPEYSCIESPNGLLKTTEIALPDLSTTDLADAMRFHEELRTGMSSFGGSYDSHPIIARTQPTSTSARLVDGRVETLHTIDGRDEGGDGTVPRLSSIPYGVVPSNPMIRYVKDKHGALPANEPVLAELEGVLTASDVIAKDMDVDVGVICDDVVVAGEPIGATIEAESDLLVDVGLHGPDGAVVAKAVATDRGDNSYEAAFADVAPGAYVLRVGVRGANGSVASPLVVLPPIEDD